MPYATAAILRAAAGILTVNGLHTGKQMATKNAIDISAAIYWAAHRTEQPPVVFFTDEDLSLRLIESSETAMAAIKALSDALDTSVSVTNGQPDYIEHVSNWACTPGLFQTAPPTVSEVIGRILRAADQTTHTTAA